MERRDFLRTAGWFTGVATLQAPLLLGAEPGAGAPAPHAGAPPGPASGDVRPPADRDGAGDPGGMPHRTLGRTGERVSAIGLGGYHIGTLRDPADSIRILRRAIDEGITFLDNSWDYHGGESERRMGRALRDGYRRRTFLMTKIDGRTGKLAAQQIDESLRRLGVDHVDLMQHHEIIRDGDPDRIFAEGAHEAMLRAREAGKLRYIGFTGHKSPAIHRKMLDAADRAGFRFDAVQMPLNVMDAQFRSFEAEVLPRLVRDGIGVLGMKSLGDGNLLRSGTLTAAECLRYALSLPTSVVITGIDSEARLDQALAAARGFTPLPDEERAALLARTREAAATGRFEPFKTTTGYDATARHPEWLG